MSSMVCRDLATDPLTWIDSGSYELVPLSGVESWASIGPNQWRFKLLQGVTFHNGEVWNSTAAKLGMDWWGDSETSGHGSLSFFWHGAIESRIVDDLTIDVICPGACPIFPRSAMFTSFQAPRWWSTASESERFSTTVGFGSYKIVEWQRGQSVELEAFDDYRPNDASDSQSPTIKRAFQVWQSDDRARAAMVESGIANWAADIGFENTENVPKFATGPNNEIFTLLVDTVWHPELSKRRVRMALAHAIDCKRLVKELYKNLVQCWGATAPEGTDGITSKTSTPYEYDPALARFLLGEAGYDKRNVINLYTRKGHLPKDVAFYEKVVEFWRAVGVNAELKVVEQPFFGSLARTGCGQTDDPINCHDSSPPALSNQSPHTLSVTTSTEQLDYIRQARLRSSCYNRVSRVCSKKFERLIELAGAMPMSGQRTAALTAMADQVHDQYYFIPHFEVVTLYGLADDLEWEPYYMPRIRLNTMRFTR